MQGADATWDPTISFKGNGGACANENYVYVSTMQDNDPIRRTCAGAGTGAVGTFGEDNCSHSGDLGLVLVMNDVPELHDSGTMSDPLRYNATPCARGVFTSVTIPVVYDIYTQAPAVQNYIRNRALCPNGDQPLNTGGCIAPAVGTSSQCLASKLTAPPTTTSSTPVPLAPPVAPFIAEGRAYNQHLYIDSAGYGGTYQDDGFATPLPVTGRSTVSTRTTRSTRRAPRRLRSPATSRT